MKVYMFTTCIIIVIVIIGFHVYNMENRFTDNGAHAIRIITIAVIRLCITHSLIPTRIMFVRNFLRFPRAVYTARMLIIPAKSSQGRAALAYRIRWRQNDANGPSSPDDRRLGGEDCHIKIIQVPIGMFNV